MLDYDNDRTKIKPRRPVSIVFLAQLAKLFK